MLKSLTAIIIFCFTFSVPIVVGAFEVDKPVRALQIELVNFTDAFPSSKQKTVPQLSVKTSPNQQIALCASLFLS